MLGRHPHAYGLLELNLFLTESVGELVDFFFPFSGLQA